MKNLFFKLFYIFLIVIVASCKNGNTAEQFAKKNNSEGCMDIEKYSNEILSPNSVIINNLIPFISSKSEVEKIFGKAIRIEILDKPTDLTFLIDDKQSNLKRFYFKNAVYESNQDKLALSSISLEGNNNSITYPSIILNGKTTGFELFKPFPEHFKSKVLNNRGCNICSFAININAYKNSDSFWTLLFLQDTLTRVDFHPISYERNVQ